MSRREVIAYAITHAGFDANGKPIEGGPYEGDDDFGAQVPRLLDAQRWSRERRGQMEHTLQRAREVHPHARVIRIVRARPSEAERAAQVEAIMPMQQPSEASATAVLRELVAWWEAGPPTTLGGVLARARRVLVAAGPDPMPVVRAAMRRRDERKAYIGLIVTWTDSNGVEHERDVTPADLERTGTVIRERDEARDCGQASVCAVPPGCQRHWAERARELLVERDEAKELARVLEVERDEARRLHSAAEAQVACRSELRAQVAAADGRFRAAEAERDERARQQPAKDVVRLDDMRKLALAVAARVRQERCLVAQAVAANVDIRVCEDDGGGFMVGVHESGCDEELARCVPAADVPATLARLLGEVSRG